MEDTALSLLLCRTNQIAINADLWLSTTQTIASVSAKKAVTARENFKNGQTIQYAVALARTKPLLLAIWTPSFSTKLAANANVCPNYVPRFSRKTLKVASVDANHNHVLRVRFGVIRNAHASRKYALMWPLASCRKFGTRRVARANAAQNRIAWETWSTKIKVAHA